ncbi:hypothetical protein ACET3Z_021327 [Daucus carota]
MSDTVHAILRTFKQERDALHSSRRKLGEVLSFLKKHGFSEEQVLAEAKSDGFGSTIPVRDEFGLPVKSQEMMGKPSGVDRGFSAETLEHMSVEGKVDDIMPLKKSANPYVDKMKGQVSAEGSPLNLKDDTPAQDLSAKPQADGEGLTQTWARIVHKDAPSVKEQNTPMVREEVTEPTVNDKGNNSAAPTSMDSSVAQSVLPESPARDQLDNSEVGWTEVKRKKQCSNSDFESPSPPVTFKNLKKVDEIEGKKGNISLAGGSHPRLTKSQKRKLKASRGSSPPSLS